MPPRHICLLSEEFPPETGGGGIGTYAVLIGKGLARAGCKVTVVAGCNTKERVYEENGYTVHRVKTAAPRDGVVLPRLHKAFRWYVKDKSWLKKNVEFAWAARERINAIHAKEPIDVVETPEYMAAGLFVARQGTPPLVARLHSPLFTTLQDNNQPMTPENRWLCRLERMQTIKAKIVTSPSTRLAQIGRDWLGGREVVVVPNPIDPDQFKPEGPAKNEGNYFFYTGRLERRKGVHVLIDAFARVAPKFPGLRLLLAGAETPTFEHEGKNLPFQEFVRAKGMLRGIEDRVVFLGRVDYATLPEWYRGSLACVYPSINFENFPYTCLEALSCGNAVIATDSGGMSEMIRHDESGLVVKPGDTDALVAAMTQLAGDPGRAKALGAAARQRVLTEYALEPVTRRMLDVFDRAMMGKA